GRADRDEYVATPALVRDDEGAAAAQRHFGAVGVAGVQVQADQLGHVVGGARCACPPDSWSGLRPARSLSRSRSSQYLAADRAAWRPRPRARGEKATFSATVRCGKRR